MREPISRPPRDLRLDVVRGWLQLSIFASHAFGSFIGGWMIHAAWGLSDSSEQFVLLSGLALGSVFTLKAARGGHAVAVADMARRTWRLYLTHLVVLALFGAMVFWAERALPLLGEAERLGWSWLREAPAAAVAAAPTMLWQPAFMGILPIFVWCMLALPPFLWLAARIGAWALAVPAGLYAGVQLFGWATPPLGVGTGIAFDPLAWQVLFLGGAFLGRRALLSGAPAVPRRAAWWSRPSPCWPSACGSAWSNMAGSPGPPRSTRGWCSARSGWPCRGCCTRCPSPTSSPPSCRARRAGCTGAPGGRSPRSGGTACTCSASACSSPTAPRPRSGCGRTRRGGSIRC
jgi:hypothetical protein